MSEAVIWHDLECGGYEADLQLWRELARDARGAVLDVGAGTGRVALDLGRRGHEVTALDVEPELLAAIDERRGGALVSTVCADARAFALGKSFPLVIVPMQTVQLLHGIEDRSSFLRCARAHVSEGGLLAIALADALDGVDAEHTEPPMPDIREVDGYMYASRPVRVEVEAERGVAIERLREVVAPDGTRVQSSDTVWLEQLGPAELERDGLTAGFSVRPRCHVPATDEYVGSQVVMFGG